MDYSNNDNRNMGVVILLAILFIGIIVIFIAFWNSDNNGSGGNTGGGSGGGSSDCSGCTGLSSSSKSDSNITDTPSTSGRNNELRADNNIAYTVERPNNTPSANSSSFEKTSLNLVSSSPKSSRATTSSDLGLDSTNETKKSGRTESYSKEPSTRKAQATLSGLDSSSNNGNKKASDAVNAQVTNSSSSRNNKPQDVYGESMDVSDLIQNKVEIYTEDIVTAPIILSKHAKDAKKTSLHVDDTSGSSIDDLDNTEDGDDSQREKKEQEKLDSDFSSLNKDEKIILKRNTHRRRTNK